ncbi:hypothetical protein ACFY19_04585 [Streptosporangium saharense]|uniref:Uncharacterized protein n=1 Tax=Streptosporangium saharense TaxID=1706840 RepID=A0A7W7VM53_9ACTN|nr:hypothetical protein [Streptosporangium saharense]MBB4915119.1 hypothetical protein [Streptosporangium saharense]
MTNTVSVILLAVLATAVVIGLIVLAVRLTQRPRNSLIGGGLGPALIEQVLELKAVGEFDQAVILVRGETGLSHRAASRVVRKLHAPAP